MYRIKFGVATVLVLGSTSFATAFQRNGNNPSAPGFNAEGSDSKAIEIADQVMAAMGGRQNWDNTRFISWKLFGRFHVWDKHTGNLRNESADRTTLMNLHTKKGRVWESGDEVTHPDSLAKRLEEGYRLWINDSYWLIMPYKLKDSGVTLKYLGQRNLEDGKDAEVLQLTFEGVGVTPQNKYEVYVNKDNNLVEQWSYFRDASDETPRFTGPWHEWTTHGRILLSAERGQRDPSDIAVFDHLPDAVFEDPEPVDIMSFARTAK